MVATIAIATISCKKDCTEVYVTQPTSKTLGYIYWPDNKPADSSSFAADLAVFTTDSVEQVVITTYTVLYEGGTPDNSLANVLVDDTSFILANRQRSTIPEYGAFTRLQFVAKKRIMATPASYPILPNKIRYLKMAFKFKVGGIWYFTSLDIHTMGQSPDPFWVWNSKKEMSKELLVYLGAFAFVAILCSSEMILKFKYIL